MAEVREEQVEVFLVYAKWKTGENPWLFFKEEDAIAKYEQIKKVAEEEGEAMELRMYGGVPIYSHVMNDWATVTAHARWTSGPQHEEVVERLGLEQYEEYVGPEVTRELVTNETVCGNCGGTCLYEGYRLGEFTREYAVCTACGSALEI